MSSLLVFRAGPGGGSYDFYAPEEEPIKAVAGEELTVHWNGAYVGGRTDEVLLEGCVVEVLDEKVKSHSSHTSGYNIIRVIQDPESYARKVEAVEAYYRV